MTDARAVLKRLADAGVEFIVVGGVAAVIHGSTRLTLGLDVVYRRSVENIARLVTALSSLKPYLRGAPPGLPFQFDDGTIRRGLNFTLTTDLGDLDFLGGIVGGGSYDELRPQSEPVVIAGTPCWVLGLTALIRAKRAAGRPKDLEAIAELEALVDETKS